MSKGKIIQLFPTPAATPIRLVADQVVAKIDSFITPEINPEPRECLLIIFYQGSDCYLELMFHDHDIFAFEGSNTANTRTIEGITPVDANLDFLNHWLYHDED